MRPLLILIAFATQTARADRALASAQLRCATLLAAEAATAHPESTADVFRRALLELGEPEADPSPATGAPAVLAPDRSEPEGLSAARARLREAFRLAHGKETARVRRTVVVGAEAIREHVLARAAALREAERAYDLAEPTKKTKPGVSPWAAGAHTYVSGSTGFKIGTLGLFGWKQAHKGHVLIAGAAAVAAAAITVPLVKISGTSFWTHVKQTGINRGWFDPIEIDARLDEADARHDERLLAVLAADDTDAVVYRGERFRIGLRRTEEFDLLFRRRLPTPEAIKKATFDRKGQTPAVDDRRLDWDEVLRYDQVARRWELHAQVHEVR